jgi:ABC-type transporter Mla subunit MlaD
VRDNLSHIVMIKNHNIMNALRKLNKLSASLSAMLEDLDMLMDNIDNDELYNELDNNVRSSMESTLTQLDMTIDDVSDGLYEKDPFEEEGEEWD